MRFPKDFLFGAATSAHQVEGNNHNDWSEWEKKNAERLSKASGGKYPPENYISGRACDHYNRFREDFDIAKSLGHNAHRFSIEWSRIEPKEGNFNEKEIEHYREVVKALRERGMEPFVTLWHWTLPLWMRDKGGVCSKEFPKYFARYAEHVARHLGKDVKYWITLNETNVQTSHGYLKGDWPPEKRSLFKYFAANRYLANAHAKAYKLIKKHNPSAQVGVTELFIYFSQSRIKSFFWNHFFLRKIKTCQDFIGIDYYFSDRKEKERSEFLDWPIDPEGLYKIIQEVKGCGKPVYIIENGIADAKDFRREKFIKEHLEWVSKAISEGVDVRGYFYWSLLDNFEWDKGFWPRFGLVEVDHKTMERKIRPSAKKLTEIIKGL